MSSGDVMHEACASSIYTKSCSAAAESAVHCTICSTSCCCLWGATMYAPTARCTASAAAGCDKQSPPGAMQTPLCLTCNQLHVCCDRLLSMQPRMLAGFSKPNLSVEDEDMGKKKGKRQRNSGPKRKTRGAAAERRNPVARTFEALLDEVRFAWQQEQSAATPGQMDCRTLMRSCMISRRRHGSL